MAGRCVRARCALRNLRAAFLTKRKESGADALSDADAVAVIRKSAKQLVESIEAYERAIEILETAGDEAKYQLVEALSVVAGLEAGSARINFRRTNPLAFLQAYLGDVTLEYDANEWCLPETAPELLADIEIPDYLRNDWFARLPADARPGSWFPVTTTT